MGTTILVCVVPGLVISTSVTVIAPEVSAAETIPTLKVSNPTNYKLDIRLGILIEENITCP